MSANTLQISLCNPEQIRDQKELRQALERANTQISALSCQLANLTRACFALTTELSVMCEAHLAGDSEMVGRKVDQFSRNYQKSCRAGVVH